MHWIHRHLAWVLFTGLVILLVANAWLFLPRYVLSRQKLTAGDLQQQMLQLQSAANGGAKAIRDLSTDPTSGQARESLTATQQRVDDIVVELQHAPYEVALTDEVAERLQLAQVVAFTMRDASFDLSDTLKMSRTAQVLFRAATSAEQLSQLPK